MTRASLSLLAASLLPLACGDAGGASASAGLSDSASNITSASASASESESASATTPTTSGGSASASTTVTEGSASGDSQSSGEASSGAASSGGSSTSTSGSSGALLSSGGPEGSSSGAAESSTGGPMPCQVEETQILPTPSDVLLVLDKSGSMSMQKWDHDDNPQTPTVTRWNSLHGVVESVVTKFNKTVNFGVKLYPKIDAGSYEDVGACIVNPGVEVEIAPLNAAKVLVNEGEMMLYAGQQEFSGQFSNVLQDPDRLSFATRILQFESRQVLVADSAWTLAQSDTAALMPVDSAGVATLKASLHGDLVHLLRAAHAPGSRAARRGVEAIRGRNCDLVDFVAPGGTRWRFAIDVVTHRVLAIDGALGNDLKWHQRRLYSEFKPVSGLILPTVEERFAEGERVSRFTTTRASVNQEIDQALFRKPKVIRGMLFPGD